MDALAAGLWGLLGGSALVVGALIAFVAKPSQRLVAGVMAFGSGVLISALAFELMDEAYRTGGFAPTAIGFLSGAAIYTAANIYLSKRGAKHRKRSGHQQTSDSGEDEGAGLAIAVGALLDGIPESLVIGLSLLNGGGISLVTVGAVFLSNVPEGLSSAAGMRKAGRSATYIFGVWIGIALISGLSAYLGYFIFADAGPSVVAATNAVAAGAILAMLADTMIPEAFEHAHDYAGLITVSGFLMAFVMSKLDGP